MSSRLPDTASSGWSSATVTAGVTAQTRALQAARDSLNKSPEAPAAARRLARALHAYADKHRIRAIIEAAEGVEHAAQADLARAVDRLIAETEIAFTPPKVAEPVVLFVEPDRLIAQQFDTALRANGRSTVVVRTAAEAQEILATQPVSVIVLALNLPDGDGRNLLLSVKSSAGHSGVGVVVTSEFRDELVREECLALGADAYFEKPVAPIDIETSCLALVQRTQVTEAPKSDPVTGLASHAEFCTRYTNALALVEAGGQQASLALLDFGGPRHNERINPLDEQVAIAAVARMLRDSDIVGRWSGNQIVALLPNTDYRAAISAVHKLTEEIRAARFRSASGEILQFDVAASVIPLAYGADIRDSVRDAERVLNLAVPNVQPEAAVLQAPQLQAVVLGNGSSQTVVHL